MKAKNTAVLGYFTLAKKLKSLDIENIYLCKNGNKPIIIIANKEHSRTVYISSRARSIGTWQTSISYGKKSSKKNDENIFWIFVDLIDQNHPSFFIVPEWWIKNNIYKIFHLYISKHNGKRKINPKSTHHSIDEKRILEWKDRWDLLGILK
jgi:hypothetical protein